MSRFTGVVSAFVLFLVCSSSALAAIADIRSAALPQEDGVLVPLKDAAELEMYTHSWTQNWKYPIPRAEVATRLGVDLASLSSAIKAHPDNVELFLLTGLVARYSYNLDVPGSYDMSMAAFAQAEKLSATDIRGPWFRAALKCQTAKPVDGAEVFLAIEINHPWDQLPIAFWTDYMECASVTNMPAHVLRANSYLAKLKAPISDEQTFLADVSQKRFDAFDPEKNYAPKEVWQADTTGTEIAFTNTTCGVRIYMQNDWTVDELQLAKGSCVADFSTGPYKDKASKMRPSILVMIQQPQNDETLEQYSKHFQEKGQFVSFKPDRCPSERCISVEGTRTGAYGKDGDGHGFMLFFERNQPEFPGLLFESPSQMPQSSGSTAAHYFRPSQTLQRIPGKLYYVVLLDTAASIEDPAMKDFDSFLTQLVVE